MPYTATNGTCRLVPHHERLSSWGSVAGQTVPSVAALKQAIYDYGPIAVAVCANSAMSSYRGGVFTGPSCTTVNHAVILTGWDDTGGYWYMKNSWGTGWGESGYMRIQYGVSQIGYNAAYVTYQGSGVPTPTPTAFVPTPTRTPTPIGPTPTRTATPAGGTWQPNTYYAAGAQVTYGGCTYRALQSHTSQVGWEPPNAPALWQLVGCGTVTPVPTATVTRTPTGAPPTPTRTPTPGGNAWQLNTYYAAGAIVTYSGHTYRCLQAHTSQVGWEPPNVPALWQLIQ